ncbi:MAG: insulinase family protein [Granulosicoccus sp.]
MEQEAEIIQREYDLNYRDDKRSDIWLELKEQIHSKQWPGRSFIGTPKSVASLTLADAIDLHRKTHTPANTVLLIVGNHSVKSINKLIYAVFKEREPGDVPTAAFYKVTKAKSVVNTTEDEMRQQSTVYQMQTARLNRPATPERLHTMVGLPEYHALHSAIKLIALGAKPLSINEQSTLLADITLVELNTLVSALAKPCRKTSTLVQSTDD